MTKNIFILVALLPLFAHAQQQYVVKGNFHDTKRTGKVYLTYKIGGLTRADSAVVTSGVFELSGPMPAVTSGYLQFVGPQRATKKTSPDAIILYLEPGQISIVANDSLKHATIKGSKVNDDYLNLNNLDEPLKMELNRYREQYSAIPKHAPDLIQQQQAVQIKMKELAERRKLVYKNFVRDNPNSYISLFVIRDVAGPYMDQENGAELFAGLSDRIKNSPDGKQMKTMLDGLARTAKGNMAPVFSQPDTAGKIVYLTDFKGKYVLVDFWASWCHPCRAENPRLLKAYNRFKDKGFSIVGISIDQEKMRNAWLKAIKDDGMPWTQLIDANADKNGAAALYGVKAIPSNFLINPEGKIVARNLRGEDIEKTIESILKDEY